MKTNPLLLITHNFESITRRFTPKTFEKFNFSYLFYLTPISISSYFTIEILKNRFK